MHALPRFIRAQGLHVKLNIRAFYGWPGAREKILQTYPELFKRIIQFIVKRSRTGFEHQPDLQMILQVLSHAWQCVRGIHPIFTSKFIATIVSTRIFHEFTRALCPYVSSEKFL